jgi:Fur family peroxide stress response transcriptional regulator
MMMTEDISKIVELLQSHGIRITPQRLTIIQTMMKLDHPTAEEIHDELENVYINISIATVYNTIRSLKEIGLVREINCGEGCTRFEIIDDSHYHLICKQCGRIDDIHFETDIDFAAIASASGFDFKEENIEIYGLCPQCKN